jgi:hypothetical protein
VSFRNQYEVDECVSRLRRGASDTCPLPSCDRRAGEPRELVGIEERRECSVNVISGVTGVRVDWVNAERGGVRKGR